MQVDDFARFSTFLARCSAKFAPSKAHSSDETLFLQ
jgi:hypothetical protein